jgi:branched-chain amino acid transport system permease protein
VIVGSLVIGGLVGLIEYYVAIKPLRTAKGYAALVTTVGFAVLLQGLVILIWGITPHQVSIPGENDIYSVLGGRLPVPDLVALVVAVVLTIALTVGYHRTRWGLASRAAISDATAAQLRGVNVSRIRVGGFVLAGAIACAVGPVVGAQTTAYSDLGNNLLILGFVALTLGGFGSYSGSLIGGLIVGAIELVTQRYLSGDNYWFILYGLFLVVLLVRPTGILGRRTVSRAV